MEFQAAIFRAVGTPMAIERVRLLELGPQDVLVRIHAAGLCHTDWEAAQGHFGASLPAILGHEGAGIVEDVGSAVTRVKRGDPVVCSPFATCGTCYYCLRQQPMHCEIVSAAHRSGRFADGRTRLTVDGRPVHHFLSVSSFAEYAVLPEGGAVVVPNGIPLDRACMLGCAVITGVGAALHVADIRAGDTACVLGCGPVGLNAVQGARLAGAERVVAVDISVERREMAGAFGATDLVDPRTGGLKQILADLTAGRGADCCFEAAGRETTLQQALDVTRPGGTITILGKMPPDQRVSLRFGSLMGDRTIRRSTLGGARCQDDIPAFAEAYLDGRLLLDPLITERIPLALINEGLDRVGRGETVRTIVTP